MGDKVTFSPITATNPVFGGRGSVIKNPDILPIFWGPYWPGSGEMTVGAIMQALNKMVQGSYLQGLTQYGYSGSASVRPPRVDRNFQGILLGLAPSVLASVDDAVNSYLKGLIHDDAISDVDDNHELIVVVFLDPSVPSVPNPFTGGSTVFGDNSTIEIFELFDDNTRFERCWVSTSSYQLAAVTQTLSHELVEAISDPFDNGWHQNPDPGNGAGQLTDVYNQNAISDGAAVTAYWSVEDAACVVPTSAHRSVRLSQTPLQHEVHDSETRDLRRLWSTVRRRPDLRLCRADVPPSGSHRRQDRWIRGSGRGVDHWGVSLCF